MKRFFTRIFLMILACLMISCSFTSCLKKQEGTGETEANTTVNTTVEADGDATVPDGSNNARTLAGFTIVHADDASESVKGAVNELKSEIEALVGLSLSTKTDGAARSGSEIVIGATKRSESKTLDSLAYDGYILKTATDTDGHFVLIVGGGSDDATVKSIYELIAQLKTLVTGEGAESKLSDVDIKGSTKDLVISDDVAKSMVIIYSRNADNKVQKIAKLLQNDMNTALGVRPEIVTVPTGGVTTQYKNAIILGGAGAEGAAIKGELSALASYTAKVEHTKEGTRVYLVGATDLSTIRATQYFYSQAVVDGDFKIPKYLDVSVTTLYQRDPGILLHDGVYYLYENYNGGWGVKTSTDLIHWSAVKQVWQKVIDEPTLDADSQYWAPEGHYYNGKFYIFATYGVSSYGNTGTSQRGCVVLECDTPDGRFKMISKPSANSTKVGWITPNTMSAIDGHLYVDEAGKPWLVFVREWTHTSDKIGRISYAPMSDDLTHLTGAWHDMIKADDPTWTTRQITDGPYMYKATNGDLFMIWSNKTTNGDYVVGLAKSSNGKLDGTWTHIDPLFMHDGDNIYTQTDGGHACIFTGLDGRIYLGLHTINDQTMWVQNDNEWPDGIGMTAVTFIPIVESDGTLKLDLVK